ncbi:hypothetical protein D3C85_452180 [compost metagenome]
MVEILLLQFTLVAATVKVMAVAGFIVTEAVLDVHPVVLSLTCKSYVPAPKPVKVITLLTLEIATVLGSIV